MKKLLALLPAVCLALLSSTAKADTLTFNGVPGGGNIGPYSLTLGSTGANLALFCMNDTNFIQTGESWTVDVVNGGSLTGPLATQYEEEAYIYSQYNGSNATDIQEALWYVFDNTESIDSGAQNLITAATNLSNPFYTDGALDGYTFYLYNNGPITDQYENYSPQNFIGVGPSPAPEPSSLMMLGSGLVGLAGVARRKMFRA